MNIRAIVSYDYIDNRKFVGGAVKTTLILLLSKSHEGKLVIG